MNRENTEDGVVGLAVLPELGLDAPGDECDLDVLDQAWACRRPEHAEPLLTLTRFSWGCASCISTLYMSIIVAN
jgi:hypothetical protein